MLRPRWSALLGTAALLAAGCRDNAILTVVGDDVVLRPVDLGAEAALPDAPALSDVPVAMDAAVAMDAVADDVPAPRDVRSDARADVRRDTGPSCVCPPLPTTCVAPMTDTPAFSPESALLNQVLAVVSCANTSLHLALYETLWDCLPNAILARLDAAPSLTVQIVVDDEDCPAADGGAACPIRRLEGHPRVTLVADNRSALMHHKFIVADNRTVWVGSANSSQQSYCQDANDAVVLAEPTIVAAFEGEFQRMFRDRNFGPIAAENPATGGIYTAYFSPRSPTTTASRWFTDMIGAINTARTSVDFIIASWTRDELSNAMLAARMRGVTVRGVVAPNYINDAPAVALRAAGVPLRVGAVHSKLLIIDDQTVITGSANWSASAWANNENSLWIRDGNIGTLYGDYFTRVFNAATVPLSDRDR